MDQKYKEYMTYKIRKARVWYLFTHSKSPLEYKSGHCNSQRQVCFLQKCRDILFYNFWIPAVSM
jgi:hypothetical protein